MRPVLARYSPVAVRRCTIESLAGSAVKEPVKPEKSESLSASIVHRPALSGSIVGKKGAKAGTAPKPGPYLRSAALRSAHVASLAVSRPSAAMPVLIPMWRHDLDTRLARQQRWTVVPGALVAPDTHSPGLVPAAAPHPMRTSSCPQVPHVVHAGAAYCALYSPEAHQAHSVLPSAGACRPGAHGRHLSAPSSAMYVPAAGERV